MRVIPAGGRTVVLAGPGIGGFRCGLRALSLACVSAASGSAAGGRVLAGSRVAARSPVPRLGFEPSAYERVITFAGPLNSPGKLQRSRREGMEEFQVLRGQRLDEFHGSVGPHLDFHHRQADDADFAEIVLDDDPVPEADGFHAVGLSALSVADVVHGDRSADADNCQGGLQAHILGVGLGDLAGHMAESALQQAEIEIGIVLMGGVVDIVVKGEGRIGPLREQRVVQKTDLDVRVMPGMDLFTFIDDAVLFQGPHSIGGFSPSLTVHANDSTDVGDGAAHEHPPEWADRQPLVEVFQSDRIRMQVFRFRRSLSSYCVRTASSRPMAWNRL